MTGYLTLLLNAPADPSPTSYAPQVLGLALDHTAAALLVMADIVESSDPDEEDAVDGYEWEADDDTAVYCSRGPDTGVYVVIHLIDGKPATYGPCPDLLE
jgi:hypothetical protein